MKQHNILINLSNVKDITILSASIKAYLVNKDRKLSFLLEGDDKDFVAFQGYEGVKKYTGEEEFDLEVIRNDNLSDDRLLHIIHKKDETRSYLLILKEYNEDYIKKAISYVSKIYQQKNIKASLLSENLPDDNHDLITKRVSQKEFFQSHEPLLIISEYDFSLLKEHYEAFTRLYFEDKEKKKSIFSDIGSFFFKNYTSQPKVPNLKDSLSFQEILLGRETLTINLLREGESADYHNLFTLLEEILED